MFLFEAPERPRITKSVKGTTPNPKKEDVYRHVAKGWFPVNHNILSSIKQKLLDGTYVEERAGLIDAVKSDPALYIYCARSLRGLTDSTPAGLDPLEELKKLEEQKLKNLFAVSDQEISAHQIRDMNPKQAACLQFSLMSSHTAQAMAEKVAIPPQLAFAGATFRQLGMNLISWNYPRLYAQAAYAHRKHNTPLEFELRKMLGVAPADISSRCAAEWGLSAAVRQAVAPNLAEQEKTALTRPQAAEPLGSRPNLLQVCQLSELFAKTKDPATYPEAPTEWQAKEKYIKATIGSGLLHKVEEKVQGLIETFADASPAILHLPLAANALAKREEDNHGLSLMTSNHYVQQCPDHIKKLFLDVYNNIEQAKVSLDAIQTLVELTAPALGFPRGCLYLADKKDYNLKPALRIGRHPLEAYGPFLEEGSNDILASQSSNVPFVREAFGIEGRCLTHVCGSLGHPRYPGVLYLELDGTKNPAGMAPVLYFNAVRKTLNDCLGQSGDVKAK